MIDYYKILGVGESASPDEIKKAYRSLANKHHPDKGGDQARFKDISVAYENLSNDQKRAEYDQQRMHGGGPQFHFNTGGGFDPFGNMFPQGHPFGDIFSQMRNQGRKNRDLNIQCQITLLDSFQGKQLEANFQLPSGKTQTVVIDVPTGMMHGDTIRYNGLGDDSVAHLPRGNLNVTLVVLPDANYRRQDDDLYTTIHITPIEAMIGCKKKVRNIAGSELELEIRAGVEAGTEFASPGQGFRNIHTGRVGRFVTVVNLRTPVINDQNILNELKRLNDVINKLPK